MAASSIGIKLTSVWIIPKADIKFFLNKLIFLSLDQLLGFSFTVEKI
jgi:hypothetical protein